MRVEETGTCPAFKNPGRSMPCYSRQDVLHPVVWTTGYLEALVAEVGDTPEHWALQCHSPSQPPSLHRTTDQILA